MIQNNYIQYKPYKYVLDDEYIKSVHKNKSSMFNFEPHCFFRICNTKSRK